MPGWRCVRRGRLGRKLANLAASALAVLIVGGVHGAVCTGSAAAGHEALVMRRFGKTPAARWDAARRLYDAAGLQAQFRLYRGVGHKMSPEMKADVEALFRAALAAR